MKGILCNYGLLSNISKDLTNIQIKLILNENFARFAFPRKILPQNCMTTLFDSGCKNIKYLSIVIKKFSIFLNFNIVKRIRSVR